MKKMPKGLLFISGAETSESMKIYFEEVIPTRET
jgi:hypothetical protein